MKLKLNLAAVSSLTVLVLTGTVALVAAETKPVYQNDFSKAAVGQVPEDMLVLDGGFAVKEDGSNRFLELPGAPLETYGVLFGPTEGSGLEVNARIQSTSQGRRYPTFAVGLNGVGGYKLQISPAKKLVELYKGEELLTNAPMTWTSGSWVRLRLQSRKIKDGEIRVEGKAWKADEPEPKEWQISRTDGAGPPPGRPSLWGMPIAGTPIRFDDLAVFKAAP